MLRSIALVAAAAASFAVAAQDDPLASLVAAERAFARMSVEKGRVAAFLANFADEGIGFQPAPVKMKEALARAPAPSGPVPVLDWEPWTGAVAASGDLGYTTGPWARRPPDPAGQALYGWFFSVWRRAGSGPWRVVADIGISSPAAGGLRPHDFEPALPGERRGARSSADEKDARLALVTAEQTLSQQAAAGSVGAACRTFSADRIRLYRDGVAPIVGRDAACARVEGEAARASWQVIHAAVSQAGDLGYVYGSYQAEAAGADAKKGSGYYLRVWARTGAGWRIAAEVTNGTPEKKQ